MILHPISEVVRRTGLNVHVLRVWERRYGAVEPKRSATGRREYSDADVARLSQLAELTRRGHPIGYLARLPDAELARLGATGAQASGGALAPRRLEPAPAPDAPALLERALAATVALDPGALDAVFAEAEVALGSQGMLQRLAAPFAYELGERWRDGRFTAAHEHFASDVLRTNLGQVMRQYAATEGAPGIVVATPTGQLHDLGAMIVAAVAANLGWRVLHLGASLPAAEIAGAAVTHRARVVALSIVYPNDDSKLPGELVRLRTLLPAHITIAVGGRSAADYKSALNVIKAREFDGLERFGRFLDALRTGAAEAAL